MSISGVYLRTRREKTESVRRRLIRMAGVEVHAATDDGRLVVTVDRPDDGEAEAALVMLQNMDGVLSSSLVYNYFDQDTEE